MNDADVILIFVRSLIGYTIMVFGYMIYVFVFNVKALNFLQQARRVILEHDDIEECRAIESDIASYISSKGNVKSMIGIVFITLAVNLFTYLFAIIPQAQLTSEWQSIYIMSSIFTAYIMSTFSAYPELKSNINATCYSYALVLQSYKYVKEYEDNNNNDSSDRF